MIDADEPFHHEVTPWTVGRLRKALEGLPDGHPLVVQCAEEPGGWSGNEQVLVDVGFGHATSADGTEFICRELELSCDFPTGEYYRRR